MSITALQEHKRWWPRRTKTATACPTELQERYGDLIYAYAALRLGWGTEAEDITVEVFGAVYSRLHACPLPAAPGSAEDPARAYLLGIARRKVINVLRARSRRREVALPETLDFHQDGPESEFLQVEASLQLQRILATLRPDYQDALLLKYVEGLSLQEIGLILGKSAPQVGSLLQQAREAARRAGRGYFEDNNND